MQGTQASCDGGGSVSPDTLPSSLHTSFPRLPSFSLHLCDRFVQDNQSDVTIDNHNPMDIEEDTPNATPRVPPSADDAVAAAISLSSRPCITTRDSNVPVNMKNANKREFVDDSAFSVKKSASIDPVPSNKPSESGQVGTLSSPLPFVLLPLSLITITVRINPRLLFKCNQRRNRVLLTRYTSTEWSLKSSLGTS